MTVVFDYYVKLSFSPAPLSLSLCGSPAPRLLTPPLPSYLFESTSISRQNALSFFLSTGSGLCIVSREGLAVLEKNHCAVAQVKRHVKVVVFMGLFAGCIMLT